MASVKLGTEIKEEKSSRSSQQMMIMDKMIIYDIPLDCMQLFVLKAPGEFCISQNEKTGQLFLTVMIESEHGEQILTRLEIQKDDSKIYEIKGILFARSSTLNGLINKLRDDSINLLSGILEQNIELNKLITKSSLEENNIFDKREIRNKIIAANDYKIITYKGEIITSDGKIHQVDVIEPAQSSAVDDFRRKVFDEFRLQPKSLPIRQPVAAVLSIPALCYPAGKGYHLDYLLENYQHLLDLDQRIKICSSCVRILSEIINDDLYHGGVLAENFYAKVIDQNEAGCRTMELLFSCADGLVDVGVAKRTVMLDYDLYAPEVAFTRLLTRQSGVFNMGRLFERILEPDMKKNADSKTVVADPPSLAGMKILIEKATRSNPYERPTIDGLVMMIRQILTKLAGGSADTKFNFVHYDQFE